MGISTITSNEGVKGLSFLPAIEGLNELASKAFEYQTQLGDVTGTVVSSVDSILDITGVNSLMAANPAISQAFLAGGAGMLSNKILKDLGLIDEGKGIKSLKNLSRYGINLGAMVGVASAGTAAAPYLLAGAGAYFAGKYGWKFSKELTKRGIGTAWGLTGGLAKGAAMGVWNSVKAGIKGEQKINPVI